MSFGPILQYSVTVWYFIFLSHIVFFIPGDTLLQIFLFGSRVCPCLSLRRLSPNSWTFSTLPHLHHYLRAYNPWQGVAGIAHVHNTSLLRHNKVLFVCSRGPCRVRR
jgi:hypothetical protein